MGECYKDVDLTGLGEDLYASPAWLGPRLEQARPDMSGAARALCTARLSSAMGGRDEVLAENLARALMMGEGSGDPALGWLALEAADLLIELGNSDAGLRVLDRHRARFSGPSARRREAMLRRMAMLLPSPGPDGLTAFEASLANERTGFGTEWTADRETQLTGLAFAARSRGALDGGDVQASAWRTLRHLAEGGALNSRRFAVEADRNLARLALAAGEADEAARLAGEAMQLATMPLENGRAAIGVLDKGLALLAARARQAQGTSLTAQFTPSGLAGTAPTGDLYSDFSLPDGAPDLAGREALLGLYRDLYEERGLADVIARPSIPDIPQLPALAFQNAQLLRVGAADRAAAFANALRQAEDPDDRAKVIELDAARSRRSLLLRRYVMLAEGSGVAGLPAMQAEVSALDRRIEELDEDIGYMVPEPGDTFASAEGLHPWYLALRQSQQIGRDENFLLIVPAAGDVHVFAMGAGKKAKFAWHRIRDGVEVTTPLIERLRCQLDIDSCTAQALLALDAAPPSPLEQAGQAAYDRKAAYRLYELLVKPVEKALSPGADVFVVAQGKMGALPLPLLVTKAPDADYDWADYAGMSAASWLGDRYAFTATPSFDSFRPDRFRQLHNASEDMLFAVANPAFSGKETMGELRSARFFAPGGTGALADLSAIRRLAPLPGTQAEYRSIVGALAPPREVALLGTDANEAKLRGDPALGSARTILFATHSLLPRQNRTDLAEPALVLTPPEKATPDDDGLLTASEVLGLKLSADWVILSACNTAAGAGGGESLSELASAFIRAGALQVMASHWPVRDDVTPMLTTLTLKIAASDPKIGPGRALQRAMIAVRTGNAPDGKRLAAWKPDWSHPAAWAPFAVVSNGDEAIINDRFDLRTGN